MHLFWDIADEHQGLGSTTCVPRTSGMPLAVADKEVDASALVRYQSCLHKTIQNVTYHSSGDI